MAYTRSEHNADESTLGVLDVATGKPLADQIAGTKYGEPAWTPDGRGFYYVWVPPVGPGVPIADRPGFAELRFHALGTDAAKDPTIRDANHDPQTFLVGELSADGRWLFATVEHGWSSTDLYYMDLRAPRRAWRALIEHADANYRVTAFRDRFYVYTNDGAPRYRVLVVDPAQPARAAWRELIAERDDTLDAAAVIGGRLVLTYLHDATSRLELVELTGKPVRALPLPPLVAVGGVIGGYCASGSVFSARPPTSVIKIEITEAKIGRSMKKREITSCVRERQTPKVAARRHRHPRPSPTCAGVPGALELREDHAEAAGPTSDGLVVLVEGGEEPLLLGVGSEEEEPHEPDRLVGADHDGHRRVEGRELVDDPSVGRHREAGAAVRRGNEKPEEAELQEVKTFGLFVVNCVEREIKRRDEEAKKEKK